MIFEVIFISEQDDHKQNQMESNLIFQVIPLIFGGFGIVSFVWNVYNYKKTQAGFLKLNLTCSSESDKDGKRIISKTTLENTSRNPIVLAHAFLILVDPSISFESATQMVIQKISIKIGRKKFNEEAGDRPLQVVSSYAQENNNVLVEDDFIFITLPYYFETHIRLGSFANMKATHIQEVLRDGTYSIYFAVIAENWYLKPKKMFDIFTWPYRIFRKDKYGEAPTWARTVQDQVLVN
jgi:hypothetical protein